MAEPRFSWFQQLLPFLRGSWTCPQVDDISRLPRDRRRCRPVPGPDWPSSLASVPVRFGGTRKPTGGTVSGKPVQFAGAATETWTVLDPWTGEARRFEMPVPFAQRTVQGYPLRDGAFDRASIVVTPDEVVEAILTFPDLRRVGRFARWTHDGQLIEGRPTSRSHQPAFRTILGTSEAPHRLAISVPDYSRRGNAYGGGADQTDGTGDYAWPCAGSLVRLTDAACSRSLAAGGQVARVAHMLRVHGAWIFDRSGPTVPQATIWGQWGAWTSVHQPWTLADFEPAIDDDQPRYGEALYR